MIVEKFSNFNSCEKVKNEIMRATENSNGRKFYSCVPVRK